MTWLTFTIGVLATFRISLMFTKEAGPAWIFRKLRRAPARRSAVHEWLSCFFCFSVTASLIVCLAMWLSGARLNLPSWALLWLSFSAAAILINQKFTRGDL